MKKELLEQLIKTVLLEPEYYTDEIIIEGQIPRPLRDPDYPDYLSAVQDSLQEKQDNDELTELELELLNYINKVIKE